MSPRRAPSTSVTSRTLSWPSATTAAADRASPTTRVPLRARLALTSQDILNFALNLEYLEAQFYHIAAFGTQLSQDLLSGTGNRGYVQVRLVSVQGPLTAQNNAGSQVPFNSSLIRQYAISVACVVALARPADRAATMR